MTEHSWPEAKARAIRVFGNELPNSVTEEAILHAFREAPALVLSEIDEVASDKRNGRVRSGWAVLRSRLVQALTSSDVVVSDADERAGAVRRAETWVKHAGLFVDRESEFRDEVAGLLGPFGREAELVDRLVGVWREERPRGEYAELESLVYQERCVLRRRAVGTLRRDGRVRSIVMAYVGGQLTQGEFEVLLTTRLTVEGQFAGRVA